MNSPTVFRIIRFLLSAFIIACHVAFASVSHAAVWRVNWDGNIPADFRSPQAANDSALVHDGDTIILAVRNTFAELNLTKKLTVIGTGYFLTENFKSPYHGAVITTIRLKAGSSGSNIQSLEVGTISAEAAVDDITIMKCKAGRITNTLSSPSPLNFRWSIVNCIVQDLDFCGPTDASQTWPHFCITGCIFTSSITLSNCSADIISNYIFLGGVSASRSVLRRNRFAGGGIVSFSDSIVMENLEMRRYIPGGTNTVSGNCLATAGSAPATTFIDDYRWEGTTDRGLPGSSFGPYAGDHPYVYSGLPPVPVILNLDAPPTVTKESGLPVNLTIKSQP